MTNPTGFLDIARKDRGYRPVAERLKHWDEFVEPLPLDTVRRQAERCMDCGVPFCHSGCPVNNLIPDWNDLVAKDQWQAALAQLHRTNNFPEFTGRVCPAPCEAACTLNLEDNPVTIKTIECEIVDRGWREGWIKPQMSPHGTGKRIAVVGSGPAGLACAQQLARMGHAPTVFEKADRIGGLLRYGIPDFKMDKALIDRRISQMEVEGVIFRTGLEIGVTVPVERIMDDYNVLVLAGGAEYPRGGDTGSDCIGTANRQGAASVTQIEILAEPPLREDKGLSWPRWPAKLRTSSSQEEGCERDFAVVTTGLEGEDGKVTALHCERDGTPMTLKADLVLLAMGFTGAPPEGVLAKAGVTLGEAGRYETSRSAIFACGDMRRGQSLVVWAIREGRECATAVDAWLRAQDVRAA
jgi:glutamate synthase (NADPH/NADH) small chain